MKSDEEIMEILEAFDLTRSFKAAAELAGCSHHTVEHYVARRDEGRLAGVGEVQQRPTAGSQEIQVGQEFIKATCGGDPVGA